MAGSLKEENSLRLYGVMAGNLIAFYTLVKGSSILAGDWGAAVQDLGQALPAGLGLLLTGIVNAQLSADAKGRVVFLRWRNPLPGSEAFTRHAHSDHRVDLNALQRQHGPLPTDPRQQNALWYKLYKSVESEPAVIQAHRAFLFARDYTCIALMMLIVLGGIGLWQISSTKGALFYIGGLALQFVLAGQAARNHGRRFVSTVLALKGASG
jgi:hypothetical protein